MLSTWWKTLQYARLVRGFPIVPKESFVARQGGWQSDMFRLSWPPTQKENVAHGDTPVAISLQDYHAAFLTSPLFQIELFLLSVLSAADRKTVQKDHLEKVASGKAKSFGPWKLHQQDGNSQTVFDKNVPSGSGTTRIMQCQFDGKPFCDTWWAIEQTTYNGLELVFGSDVQRYTEDRVKSWLVWVLDPFHNLYSRLLLASAAVTLDKRALPYQQ